MAKGPTAGASRIRAAGEAEVNAQRAALSSTEADAAAAEEGSKRPTTT